MAKNSRRIAISGYYHLINRGNGKQLIFEDAADRNFFLFQLEHYCKKYEVTVCAYCLMENHVHLLVHDPTENKTYMMRDLQAVYASYFNSKYDRVGHLFQGRYLSEPIDTERYLLTVFRYILKNPEKAGICPANQYAWSSFALYGSKDSFVKTQELCKRIGDKEAYLRFMQADADDYCLEYDHHWHDDDWAKWIIKDQLGISDGRILQTYSRSQRDAAIRILKQAGLMDTQIERLTGISRGILQHIKRN